LLGNAAPGYSSGQALNALEGVAKATLPPDMGYDFADPSYQERRASGALGATFGLSLGLVFLILSGLYESWSLPFSVLLSVPIVITGMLAATAIAIFVIPMLFVLMERLATRLGRQPRVATGPAPSERRA
jgi:HAE1 family hydrophobic/amphiphilic exporter-1